MDPVKNTSSAAARCDGLSGGKGVPLRVRLLGGCADGLALFAGEGNLSCARTDAVRATGSASATNSAVVTGKDSTAAEAESYEYNQDAALIADFAELSLVERLRAATKAARVLQRAVDERARNLGVGAQLMRSVFTLAVQLANDVGCVGVVVDAKAQAVAYYQRLGFVKLDVVAGELGVRPVPCMMFLEIGQLL